MNEAELIKRIEAAQVETALDLVRRSPTADVSLYAYGYVVGAYAGLEKAKGIIEQMLNEADEKERKK